ncbi:hypothetical protein ACWGB8_03390 [Kitasatospora sp. NPDC054939]
MKRIKAAVAAAAVLAGVGLAAGPANAADSSAVKSNCTSKQWGGKFYCGGAYGASGTTTFTFRDGTQEVFVIGTDRAVWHNWTVGGGRTHGWVSLGGKMASGVEFTAQSTSGAFTIGAMSTAGYPMYRDREASGYWGDWWTPAVSSKA